MVSTCHSLIPGDLKWQAKAALIVTVSNACSANYQARGISASRIRVVHNGVPTSLCEIDRADCRQRIRREFGISKSAPFSIAVGRVSKLKGHDLFVGAAGRVCSSIPDARFAILGRRILGAPETLEIDRIVEQYHLESTVIYPGHRHDMADIIAASDLLCVPSRLESFGQVVVESMLIGTPVIVSNVGGLPEIVEDGESGIIVPPDDVDALAEAMRSVLSDPGFADRLSKAGRQRATAMFSSEAMAEIMMGIYREAIGMSRQAQ